jgi:hypothetical protein
MPFNENNKGVSIYLGAMKYDKLHENVFPPQRRI